MTSRRSRCASPRTCWWCILGSGRKPEEILRVASQRASSTCPAGTGSTTHIAWRGLSRGRHRIGTWPYSVKRRPAPEHGGAGQALFGACPPCCRTPKPPLLAARGGYSTRSPSLPGADRRRAGTRGTMRRCGSDSCAQVHPPTSSSATLELVKIAQSPKMTDQFEERHGGDHTRRSFRLVASRHEVQ